MKRTILLPLLTACGISASIAQEGSFFMLEYPVAFPGGELKEYINKVNFRCLGVGYRALVNDNIAVGIDLSNYMFFEEKENDSYTFETMTITGKQFRYNYNVAMSGHVDYVMSAGADLRPYMGLGLGALYCHRRTNFGLYQFNEDAWQFLLQPEAGLSYYLSEGTALSLSANYFAGFDTQDMAGQTFLTTNIGLIWSLD